MRELYKKVFDGSEGEIVLRHIAKRGFVNKATYVRGDIHETMINEGMRRLALSIISYIHKDTSDLVNEIEQSEDE